MRNMIAQDMLFYFVQGRAYRIDLRQDIDAVAVGFHHAHDPIYLTGDPLQAFDNFRLD